MADDFEDFIDFHGKLPPFSDFVLSYDKNLKPELLKLEIAKMPKNCAYAVEIWPNEEYYPILIIKRESSVYTYVNRCPHAGWPLENPEGQILFTDSDDVICAGHGACFDVANGHCLGGPGRGLPLRKFAHRIENGILILEK